MTQSLKTQILKNPMCKFFNRALPHNFSLLQTETLLPKLHIHMFSQHPLGAPRWTHPTTANTPAEWGHPYCPSTSETISQIFSWPIQIPNSELWTLNSGPFTQMLGNQIIDTNCEVSRPGPMNHQTHSEFSNALEYLIPLINVLIIQMSLWASPFPQKVRVTLGLAKPSRGA